MPAFMLSIVTHAWPLSSCEHTSPAEPLPHEDPRTVVVGVAGRLSLPGERRAFCVRTWSSFCLSVSMSDMNRSKDARYASCITRGLACFVSSSFGFRHLVGVGLLISWIGSRAFLCVVQRAKRSRSATFGATTRARARPLQTQVALRRK